MKKYAKYLMLGFSLTTALLTYNNKVEAKDIYVNIPKFDVTLNGIKVKNDYSKYPLIVYKDITYFPMTYNTTRFLGVETNWNDRDGLVINQSGVNGPFDFYETNIKNANSYSARVPDFRIRLNNNDIVNSREEYPLLVFRDITYFPMTWRFCVNEFGWKYDFTNAKGLVINSKKNPTKAENKVEKEKEYEDFSKSIYYKNNYYVVKTNGKNYRLFKESSIGKNATMISDMEVKDFYQDGSKLYFTSGSSFYEYDMDKASLNSITSNKNAKDGKIIPQGKEVFYINSKDGQLYSNDRNLNKGAKVERLERAGDYVLATFEYDMGIQTMLIVYDKNGREVYKTQNQTQNAKIEGNILTYFNADRMQTETITLR